MGEGGVKNPEKHVNCVLLRIKQIEIPYETIHKRRRQFFDPSQLPTSFMDGPSSNGFVVNSH